MFSRGVPASAAAVVGFFAAAVLPRATWPLIDGDVWWHIRAGEDVLRTGAVSHVDTWSIVGAGRPWTSQDWLANVLLAAGNSLGPWGQTALSFLFGAITVLAFWVLWRAIALRVPQIGWASPIVWLSIGLVLAGPVMGVRVQVLDLLMAALVIWICWRYLVDPRRRWLLGLPVVAVVWANLHAGWILLFLLVGAVLVGEAADRLLKRQLNGPPALSWRQLRDLAVALVIALGALAINPNGVALYAYPFYTLGITSLNRYVMEWFPASLDDLFGWLLLGFVIVAVLPALLLGRQRLRIADALILLGLTLMAYRAIRFLLIVGPIGGAIAAIVLAPIISDSGLGRRAAPILARLAAPVGGGRRRLHLGLIVLLVGLGVGVSILRVSPPAQATEIARVLPAQAVDWLDANEPGMRIFNRYEWGGYIGQHRPQQPVFMDGRADVYGDELLQMYVSIIGVEGDPQSIFDRYGIDYAVYPPDTPLADWFDASGAWKRVYRDATAAIWVRR
ncbi:MAG: hypothetical protein M3R32_01205 [Chloroflexota bacterium]|nr:hypothetical protein [Chloroflexota bacterium]